MSYQDWEPSVIRAKPQSKSQQVKQGLKSGDVEVVKKCKFLKKRAI